MNDVIETEKRNYHFPLKDEVQWEQRMTSQSGYAKVSGSLASLPRTLTGVHGITRQKSERRARKCKLGLESDWPRSFAGKGNPEAVWWEGTVRPKTGFKGNPKTIYSWLCLVFIAVVEKSPLAGLSGGSERECISSCRAAFSCGARSKRRGLSCPVACGIFPDQGANLRPLHWQVASQPLNHQGGPRCALLTLSSLFTMGAFTLRCKTQRIMLFTYFSSTHHSTSTVTHVLLVSSNAPFNFF